MLYYWHSNARVVGAANETPRSAEIQSVVDSMEIVPYISGLDPYCYFHKDIHTTQHMRLSNIRTGFDCSQHGLNHSDLLIISGLKLTSDYKIVAIHGNYKLQNIRAFLCYCYFL